MLKQYLHRTALITLAVAGALLPSRPVAAQDARPVVDARTARINTRQNNSLPAIFIIGDSTVRNGTKGQRGWGDEMAPFFDPAKVNVINDAIGGRSSRTFLTDGRWDTILGQLRTGDVVIMQFGHNDPGAINEPPPVTPATRSRGTIKGNGEETQNIINVFTNKPEVVHTFGWYMRNYVTTAKAKGAIPVVCSPIPHKAWTPDGKVRRASGDYGLWARQAASQAGGLFVDLNEVIARAYEKLGQPAVEPLFADKGTHTTVDGARLNAQSVVSGLNGLGINNPVANYLSAQGKAVAPFVP